jgi:hypothetical protein
LQTSFAGTWKSIAISIAVLDAAIFGWSAVRKALEAKYPVRPQVDQPERPRRQRSSVREIHTASGFPDVIVEGRAARALRRDQASPVERPSGGLPGYEAAGAPINLEDDDHGDAA